MTLTQRKCIVLGPGWPSGGRGAGKQDAPFRPWSLLGLTQGERPCHERRGVSFSEWTVSARLGLESQLQHLLDI